MGQSDIISNLYLRRRIHRSIAYSEWGLEVIYTCDIERWSRGIGLDGHMVRLRPFGTSYDPDFDGNRLDAYNRFMGQGKCLLDEFEGE